MTNFSSGQGSSVPIERDGFVFILPTLGVSILLYAFRFPWWATAFLFSVVTTILCYLIFGVFLELQFPDGVLKVIYRQF